MMRPTSDGVTIGGSVESFERTLKKERDQYDGQRGVRQSNEVVLHVEEEDL